MNRIAAVAFASVLASTAQADQNSAFQDAKSFAGGKTQGVFTGISSGAVADKIPGYGANPSETQFFQGGQGALSGPGVTKMQNCASYTPGQNKIANQECEAVNFLARNPDVRPQFNIGANDPMVLGAKESRKNAESFFQSLGIGGGTGSSTQCTTKTTTTPAQYTTETCTSLRAIEGQQCTVGRVVNIDADANYQCDKTLTAFTSQQRQPTVSTSSCTYGRQVNIDEDSRFQCDQTVSAYEEINCEKWHGCPSGGFINGTTCLISNNVAPAQQAFSLPSFTTNFCGDHHAKMMIVPNWQNPKKIEVIFYDNDGRCGYNDFTDAELMAYGFPTEQVCLKEIDYNQWVCYYDDYYHRYVCPCAVYGTVISRKGQYKRAATFEFPDPVYNLSQAFYNFSSSGSGCDTISGTTIGSNATSNSSSYDYSGIKANESIMVCPGKSAQTATIVMTGGSLSGTALGCPAGSTRNGNECIAQYPAVESNGCFSLEARAR